MTIICRPSRLEDMDRADALVVASINDLTERHGFGQVASTSPPRFQTFCLGEDPRGLWTAQDDGDIVGFAWSWACEDLWFLAQLFVKPGLQTRGTGRALLEHTLAHADLAGARQRALITFAFNTVSQGLYIHHGFMPRFPIYAMSAPREQLVGRPRPATLDAKPLEPGDLLAEIDRCALGLSRETHHRLLASEDGIRAFGLHDKGRLVGFVYISESGHIGPLAVACADLMDAAFDTALFLAAQGASARVSCFVPGTLEGVLRAATGLGLRITLPMLMMSNRDLGGWPRYLPRNPGFM